MAGKTSVQFRRSARLALELTQGAAQPQGSSSSGVEGFRVWYLGFGPCSNKYAWRESSPSDNIMLQPKFPPIPAIPEGIRFGSCGLGPRLWSRLRGNPTESPVSPVTAQPHIPKTSRTSGANNVTKGALAAQIHLQPIRRLGRANWLDLFAGLGGFGFGHPGPGVLGSCNCAEKFSTT